MSRRPPSSAAPDRDEWRPSATAALYLLLLSALLLAGCGGAEPAASPGGAETASAAATGSATDGSAPPLPEEPQREPHEAGAAAERGPLVVFLGDSLSAGYGLPEDQAFPSVIERRLEERGLPLRVVNAGVSGDTTAGGLARLDWLLRQDPDVLVVELGANDGLRGLPLEMTESNLSTILGRAEQAGVSVLLLGMRVPPNYGEDYAEGFAAIFPRLASEYDVPLVDFLLDGVGGRPELNLADGIHPTAKGHEIVAENVLPALVPLVRAAREDPSR